MKGHYSHTTYFGENVFQNIFYTQNNYKIGDSTLFWRASVASMLNTHRTLNRLLWIKSTALSSEAMDVYKATCTLYRGGTVWVVDCILLARYGTCVLLIYDVVCHLICRAFSRIENSTTECSKIMISRKLQTAHKVVRTRTVVLLQCKRSRLR